MGSLLSKTAIDAIFGNIEGIWSVNKQLLELMETEDVASALYKLAPFMKLYSLYANNFEKSSKTVEVNFSRFLIYHTWSHFYTAKALSCLELHVVYRIPVVS